MTRDEQGQHQTTWHRPWLRVLVLCVALLAPGGLAWAQGGPPSMPPGLQGEETPASQPDDPEAPPGDTNLSPTSVDRDSALKSAFRFGSYGRVVQGIDPGNGTGRQVRIISRPPRLLEQSYVELDFGYRQVWTPTDTAFDARMTVAMANDLFHFNGNFDTQFAIRNLYLEVQDPLVKGLTAWAGSRMYRGDDVYLLDFWPLDEQNTVGAGLGYNYGKGRRSSIRAHMGMHRLDDIFHVQFFDVPSDFGSRTILQVDRPRLVSSLRAEHHFDLTSSMTLKLVAYGEFHFLENGDRFDENNDVELLPSDDGILGGVEVGLYEPGTANYINVFFRYGANLAAFDELTIPGDLAADNSARGAKEMIIGVSANQEWRPAGILFGGYTRYFEDADGAVTDVDDVWEVGAALRPQWYVTDIFHVIGEVNTQVLRPNGVFQETGLQEVPMVFETALMPTFSLGRGGYARPQLRLIYAATFLNDAALLTFAPQDPQRNRSVRHFIGFGVEWWFNSSRG